MKITTSESSSETLLKELVWLSQVIDHRLKLYWNNIEGLPTDIDMIPAPDLTGDPSAYAQAVNRHNMNQAERLILILALAPHLQPHLLDVFFVKNSTYDRGFTEFGGIKGHQHAGFIPTGETAAFLLTMNDINQRLQLLQLFSDTHFFKTQNILSLDAAPTDEPLLSGILKIHADFIDLLTNSVASTKHYGGNFPARLLTTPLSFEDLVLDEHTLNNVLEIQDWINYGDILLNEWKMNKKIKPGFRALFYGPPGTGKTLTAALLGQTTGLSVYRIDISLVVSKYIGETEKNLALLFDAAQNKNWILFFDEADAIFGKRSETSSAHDRYANQEVSYLLQRVEDFPGIVIMSTNFKANIDEAFTRRFQSIVYFAPPDAELRKKLWQNSFTANVQFDKNIDLDEIAEKYELTGGSIINIARYCSLKAIKRNSTTILLHDIEEGIRKEFSKEGKAMY